MSDPSSSKVFAEKNSLRFPLLCDYSREVVRLYGIELRDFAGLKGYSVAKRSIFIVEKNSIVK